MRGILWFVVLVALGWLAWTEGLPRLRAARAQGRDVAYLDRPASEALSESASEADRATADADTIETPASTPPQPETTPPDTQREESLAEPPPSPAEVLGKEAEHAKGFRVELERADLGELGRLIAHEERFQVLESYLNDGAGAALPAGTRRLASAFWLALAGHPEEAESLAGEPSQAGEPTGEQLGLLRAALRRDGATAREAAGAGGRDSLAWGMRMALLRSLADDSLRGGRVAEAVALLSDLIRAGIDAPWTPDGEDLRVWAKELAEVQENHRWNPAGSWPSLDYEVRSGQSLVLIRKDVLVSHPDLLLCVGQIRRSNRLGDRPIQPGDRLRIPTDVAAVRIDLDSHLLLLEMGGEVAAVWEVGIGRAGEETPTGTFTVGLKQENPSYMPVGRPNLPFGHPENPLGTRWIAWYLEGERTGYGIHGTNDPSGVGDGVSNGCIRMRNDDVEVLFEILPVGSLISVQP